MCILFGKLMMIVTHLNIDAAFSCPINGWMSGIAYTSSFECLSFSLEPTLFLPHTHTVLSCSYSFLFCSFFAPHLSLSNELNTMSIYSCPSLVMFFFFFKQIYIVKRIVVIWSPSNFLLCCTKNPCILWIIYNFITCTHIHMWSRKVGANRRNWKCSPFLRTKEH